MLHLHHSLMPHTHRWDVSKHMVISFFFFFFFLKKLNFFFFVEFINADYFYVSSNSYHIY